MTPAPSAGGEAKRKRRRRRRPAKPLEHASPDIKTNSTAPQRNLAAKGDVNKKQSSGYKNGKKPNHPVAVRVNEVSAGGLVIDSSGSQGLLIGRIDLKDPSRKKILWSLPKGHIEAGETPEQAALREVLEETGIQGEIARSLGVIDFWFMAGGKRIHKTVHHFLFKEMSGTLTPQITEVDEVAWFPLVEITQRLAYVDERKLLERSGDLSL